MDVHGREPWRRDGETAELGMDIDPGPARLLFTSNFFPLTGVSGLVLYGAGDGAHGILPWAADGVKATENSSPRRGRCNDPGARDPLRSQRLGLGVRQVQGLRVDAWTTCPGWFGERLDVD